MADDLSRQIDIVAGIREVKGGLHPCDTAPDDHDRP
jgi:hypothetical protein